MNDKVTGNNESAMDTELSEAHKVFRKILTIQELMGFHRHQKMAKGGPMSDPTKGRGRILALLKLKDGIATREMAQILGIRVSSLNEVLAKMEKDGYIERVQSEEDGRVMLVSLTDKGREEEQPQTRFHDRMFAGMSDEELASLGALLDRVIANIESELGEDAQVLLEESRKRREEFFGRFGEPGFGPGPHGGRGHGCRRHGGPGHGPHGEQDDRPFDPDDHHMHHAHGHGKGCGCPHRHHGEPADC